MLTTPIHKYVHPPPTSNKTKTPNASFQNDRAHKLALAPILGKTVLDKK